jgi:hypothetical protein
MITGLMLTKIRPDVNINRFLSCLQCLEYEDLPSFLQTTKPPVMKLNFDGFVLKEKVSDLLLFKFSDRKKSDRSLKI